VHTCDHEAFQKRQARNPSLKPKGCCSREGQGNGTLGFKTRTGGVVSQCAGGGERDVKEIRGSGVFRPRELNSTVRGKLERGWRFCANAAVLGKCDQKRDHEGRQGIRPWKLGPRELRGEEQPWRVGLREYEFEVYKADRILNCWGTMRKA